MKLIISFVFIMLPVIAGADQQGMKVSDLSMDRCELREVMARKNYEVIDKIAEIGGRALPVLKQLEEINSKATVPNKPIKDQLSADDLGKISELKQRLTSIMLFHLMESRRERDLKVIQEMVMIADRDYRYGEQTEENGFDLIVHSALLFLRSQINDNYISTPASSECTLEYALHSIEKEAIDNLNSGNERLENAMKNYKNILEKYGIEELDRALLSKDDLDTVNKLTYEIFIPMQRHVDFIKDIENIKLMARASDISYESNKQDIAFSGGDISAIGATIQRRNKNNEFSDKMQFAIGLWTKINEKIPPDILTEWDTSN